MWFKFFCICIKDLKVDVYIGTFIGVLFMLSRYGNDINIYWFVNEN